MTHMETTDKLLVDSDPKIQENLSDYKISEAFHLWYLQRLAESKEKLAQEYAEARQRQSQVHFINEIMLEITEKLRDKKEGSLDISQNTAFQEKLHIAREIGIEIDEDKVNFTSRECDYLLKRALLIRDELQLKNTDQMQDIQKRYQESQQMLMIVHDVQKNENQAKQKLTAGIKGS